MLISQILILMNDNFTLQGFHMKGLAYCIILTHPKYIDF